MQQALLIVGDEQTALAVVRDTLRAMSKRYAYAMKDARDPLFQRLLRQHLRRARWRQRLGQLLPDLLSHLIPPQSETLAPGTLEMLQIDLGEHRPAWHEQPQGGLLVTEILRLLPTRQRDAFWQLHVECLPLQQAARVLALTQRCVRRDASRATAMLKAILALKGCAVEMATKSDIALCAAKALALPRATLAIAHGDALRQLFQAVDRPLRRSRLTDRGRLLMLRHPLGTRLAILGALIAAVAAGLWLTQPGRNEDQARTEIQLLSSDVPLDVLLDSRFVEAADED